MRFSGTQQEREPVEQVERTYHAIVLREPVGARGIVDSRIARDPRDRKRMAALPVHDSRWSLVPARPLLPPPPTQTEPRLQGEVRALPQAVVVLRPQLKAVLD